MFTALLDTCVLWPSLQRDFLLSLAVGGLYRPIWSSAILEELEYHEEQKLIRYGSSPGEAAQRSRRLISIMRTAFDDAEVQDWERLEGTFGLPDQDDEHVVAAAVIGAAGVIVTSNLRDFPAHAIPPGIQIVAPADFAENTVAVDPIRAFEAVVQIAARSGSRGKRMNEADVLAVLAEALRDAWSGRSSLLVQRFRFPACRSGLGEMHPLWTRLCQARCEGTARS